MQTFTYGQAEKANFIPNILYSCIAAVADGINSSTIFEATFQELADMRAGAEEGDKGNTCFENIATKYPNFKVRGVLFEDLEVKNFISSNKQEQTLAGQVIVFTGELDFLTRAKATELVEERGGKVGNTVTKNTTALVATKIDGVKYKKALKFNTPIWSDEVFFDKVGRFKKTLVSGIYVYIGSNIQGEEISKLAKEGGGEYRFVDNSAAFVPPAFDWRYFETK